MIFRTKLKTLHIKNYVKLINKFLIYKNFVKKELNKKMKMLDVLRFLLISIASFFICRFQIVKTRLLGKNKKSYYFKDKTILLTGASYGLGKSSVKFF